MEKLEIKRKDADVIEQKMTRKITVIASSFLKSITFDKDKAFFNHHRVRF